MTQRTTLERVYAAREAGHVERAHVMPHIGGYSVATHSYHALSLLLILHPEPGPSPNLMRAVLWHDGAERWLGDLPSPAKGMSLHNDGVEGPETLGEAYESIEEETLVHKGFALPRRQGNGEMLPWNITIQELQWLKAVDALELLMWCLDQVNLGNRMVSGWGQSLREYFEPTDKFIPEPVRHFVLHELEWTRLPEDPAV